MGKLTRIERLEIAYRQRLLSVAPKENRRAFGRLMTPLSKPATRSKTKGPHPTSSRTRVLAFIEKTPGCTVTDISGGTGIKESTIHDVLPKLFEAGLVDRRRRATNTKYRYWGAK